MTRREALTLLASAAVTLPLHGASVHRRLSSPPLLSRGDDAFLNEMERRACLYFVEQANAENGQVLDRAAFYGNNGKRDPRNGASIAATGFGLTALCIGDRRGFLSHAAARRQVLRTLRFHAERLPHEHGFFYHFNDIETGTPMLWSEVSSIDTALLLCGVLTARAHFHADHEIVRLATDIYERVDWPWMMNDGPLFHMGWNPPERKNAGFIEATWNHYCELMMIPLLALGSPTHPVDAAVWSAWSRPTMTYDGIEYISGDDPLFVHQYSHAYFDFRGKRDAFTNYFDNSIKATRAHKAFCLDMGAPYSDDYWGITASDSQTGYQAWGGPPKIGRLDGSVVPCAAAGSLPFSPGDCVRVLRSLQQQYGNKCWGRYGFCDALHPEANWYNADVLGIDLGIGMLMAENLRSGFVWNTFGQNREVANSMRLAGFQPIDHRQAM
ncbi:MAG: glucoamylase family protein [Janthinobacterium lividum]